MSAGLCTFTKNASRPVDRSRRRRTGIRRTRPSKYGIETASVDTTSQRSRRQTIAFSVSPPGDQTANVVPAWATKARYCGRWNSCRPATSTPYLSSSRTTPRVRAGPEAIPGFLPVAVVWLLPRALNVARVNASDPDDQFAGAAVSASWPAFSRSQTVGLTESW